MEAIEWSNVEFVNNDAVLSLYNEVGVAGLHNSCSYNVAIYSLRGYGHVLMEMLMMISSLW